MHNSLLLSVSLGDPDQQDGRKRFLVVDVVRTGFGAG